MEGGVEQAKDDGYKADLAAYKRRFEEWRSLTQEGRQEDLIDIDYYDGKQITAGEKLVLSKRGQPDIVINRVRPAINGILGVIQRGKSEPRAFPRTPKDEGSADVATDTLRYIADFNRFDQIKIHCFKDMLVPGTLAAQVLVDEDMQITIERIRWEELIWDPRSRREDFSDARWMGVARWMSADDVVALYPEKKDDIEAAMTTSGAGSPDEAQMDRPNMGQQIWCDPKRRRLFVVEMYHQDAGWKRCVYISNAVLWEGESPYINDKGKAACPIEACSAYVDRDNNRYGAVRDMRDVQDEINKRRSKALHYLNTRQVQESAPGQGMGTADEARAEAARPDGVMPSGWVVVPQSDQVRGQLELLQEAKAEIERLGPNPATLGREGEGQSGRALQSRQQAGLVELAILFGLEEDWELRIYRQCWARARQFWTAPQWIRVTDDEGAPQFVGLNQPKGQPVIDPNTGQPAVDPQTGQPMEGEPVTDPATGGSVFGYKNQVADLDVDIILDSTPDTANIQQEQFQDLMQLVGSNPTYAQSVPFEMMLELSTVPHKRELIDKLKGFREQAQKQQAEQAQMQAQIGQATAQADIRETNSKAALNEVKAQNEAMQPQLDAMQMAQDERMQQGPPPGF